MNRDINGWEIISQRLKTQKRRQYELASLLEVSPSAITQAKNGDIRLSSEQLAQIASFLKMNNLELDEYYGAICNARVLSNGSSRLPFLERKMRLVPTALEPARKVTLELLKNYVPELESLGHFLKRQNYEVTNSVTISPQGPEVLEGEFSSILDFTIRIDRYPIPGEIVLLFCRSGASMVRRWKQQESQQLFISIASDKPLYSALADDIRWMRPLTECHLKFA